MGHCGLSDGVRLPQSYGWAGTTDSRHAPLHRAHYRHQQPHEPDFRLDALIVANGGELREVTQNDISQFRLIAVRLSGVHQVYGRTFTWISIPCS